MKCSFCGADNALDSNFCAECGNQLGQTTNENNNNLSNGDFVTDQNVVDTSVKSNVNFYESSTISNQNNAVVENSDSLINVENEKESNNVSGKKKNLPLIISLIAIFCLIVILIIGVIVLNPSPKKIFTGFTNKLYSSLEESMGTDYDSAYMNMEFRPIIDGTDSQDLENIINNFSIKISGGIDYKNKVCAYNLTADYKDKDLLNMDMQYNKNFYLIMNNLYDKPIISEESDFSEIFEKSDNDDVKIVIKKYVEAFNKSLKSEYLNNDEEEVILNGKKEKVRVTILDLTKENSTSLSNDILNYLIDDEEFIKAYAKISDTTVTEAKDELKQGLNEETDTDMKISLYTKKVTNEFIKISISSEDTKIEIEPKTEDNILINVTSEGISVVLDFKYSVKYNEKVKLSDVSNAVNQDEVSTDALNILDNFTKQEGYKALNEDIKESTGSSIDELLSYFMGFTDEDDDVLNYDYDTYNY